LKSNHREPTYICDVMNEEI